MTGTRRTRVVVAPDSFKDCLPARAVAAAMAEGVKLADPSALVTQVPMADGGEGTVEALVAATGGETRHARVTGPLGDPVLARYGVASAGELAVIEMAAASGLELVPAARRNPLMTTTRGTGELILAAIRGGAKRILVGIGGSATNDGGVGMAQALGYRFLDQEGAELGPGGGELARLARIELPDQRPWESVPIEVACDVTNPLTGPEGASAVYGPQKGATPEMVKSLDENLARLAGHIRQTLGIDVDPMAGSGAAGGLGGGLVAFAGARLRRGVELVIEAVGLEATLQGADLCLTGEGSLDASSQFGKTAVGVARVCAQLGVPVVVLAGARTADARAVLERGVTAYFTITPRPCSLAEALADASHSLTDTAEQVTRLFLRARGGSPFPRTAV